MGMGLGLEDNYVRFEKSVPSHQDFSWLVYDSLISIILYLHILHIWVMCIYEYLHIHRDVQSVACHLVLLTT